MPDAAHNDDEPLTPQERAELRRLLQLLRRGAGEPVDAEPAPKVRRTATDEDFAEVERLRRRKGLVRGR